MSADMNHRLAILPLTLLSLLLGTTSALAQPATRSLDIKYVRDSAEYATLSRQVYRTASDIARRNAAALPKGAAWGVVLDVDETTLDNSLYQIERTIYGQGYEDESWTAWCARKEAGNVPGALDFLNDIRAAGGRVVFITDRAGKTRTDTQANLEKNGLMKTGDLLCTLDTKEYTKVVRRKELATGDGRCAFPGVPLRVVAFMGDQMTDFPRDGEQATFPGAGDDREFGRTFFIIPNPMYGQWTNRVTR